MPDKRIKRLIYKTYLAMIKNSIGTKMFQDLYILTGDKNKISDAMGRGDKSCAWFVSSVLYLSGFIKSSHATVGSVIKDMEEFGWKRTKKPRSGDIVLWEKQGGHEHIGFYWDKTHAISNSSRNRSPRKHHLTYNNKRKVEAIYTYKKLKG